MKKKYLVFYSTGDFTGQTEEHKVVLAESPYEALENVVEALNQWLDAVRPGFAPYYSNVKVYRAPRCLTSYEGRDKNSKPMIT